MFFWRQSAESSDGVGDWLLANKHQVLAGDAEFEGTPVSESTQFYQYKYVVSLGLITFSVTTPYFLPTAANSYLRFAAWHYNLLTLVFGWWCFPWGPPYTLQALLYNGFRGRRRSAVSLIQLLETGWDAPHDASVSDHRRDLVELEESAAQEIRARMASGGFADELAVRITPTRWADSEVAIAFDYPVSDGRDWIDESQGLTLLVEKRYEAQLSGRTIVYVDSRFTAEMNPRT